MDSERTTKTLAILSYHKIGRSPDNWESWFYIPEEIFVGQLKSIKEQGWQVINISDFLQGLKDPQYLPERAMLLTFDDGYQSLCDVALPWLQRFAFPAIVFVPTDHIGGKNIFDSGVEPEETICDWDHLRELERSGVSVQSHSASHRWFSHMNPTEQMMELVRSKEMLERNLGNRVEILAFPYGDSGNDPQEVRGMLKKAGYRAACMYGGGPMRLPMASPFGLERVAMGPDTVLTRVLKI